jgi:hypothetical protein
MAALRTRHAQLIGVEPAKAKEEAVHMSTPSGDQWVEGTYESGADEPQRPTGDVPNRETGVGLGMGQESTFEPEEDAEADDDDDGT